MIFVFSDSYPLEQNNMQEVQKSSRVLLEKIDQLIFYMKSNMQSEAKPLLQFLANQTQIQKYFKSLDAHFSCTNFSFFRKYETLNDGLYILLKGQISYMYNQKLSKIEKSKMGKPKTFKDINTTLLNETLTVFECTHKNCTTYEESFLIRIDPQLAIQTQFYENFHKRKDLFSNHYISQDHRSLYGIQESNKIINAEMKIHTNFSFTLYTFRQVIRLFSPAIISSGRVKLKLTGFSSHEFDRYGLLLPNLIYEVSSSALELMVIRNHSTLSYNINLSVLNSLNNAASSLKKVKRPVQPTSIPIPQRKYYSSKQNVKRKKEFAIISKQIESYSIFPTFLCAHKFEGSTTQDLRLKFQQRKKVNFHKTLNSAQSSEKFPIVIPDICSRFTKTNPSSPKCQRLSPQNLQLFRSTSSSIFEKQQCQNTLIKKRRTNLPRQSQKALSCLNNTIGPLSLQVSMHQSFIRQQSVDF